MAVAKRQGREKPAEIEQRKVKGRSEDRSEDFALLAKPSLHSAGRGRWKHIKRGIKGLWPSFSLSLQRTGALFSSCLWVDMPSCLEDGCSCYYLNKIEL